MSRQTSPLTTSPSPGSSPIDQRAGDISQPSTSSPRRMSKDSEGYPSWLPKRPPPPAPASTFHSSVGLHDPGPSEPPPFVGGRRATPRSVRIVSLRQSYVEAEKARREQADQGRFPNNARAWSKATTAGIAPGLLERALQHRTPQPKFRSKGLHLELLRNPSIQSRLYFYLYPLFIFAHIPLQTFFDFNAVFILFQVSKFPNPEAPGVPGSGRNWALGTAAYIACWAVWIFVVTVMYELVYSFIRRWRIKRPLVLPIYMSTPAFNFASMTSYSTFCFLQRLRYDAFFSDSGSLRDGLAETFWFYSQNLPTVGLLLPRAGLSLALLLAFTTPQPGVVALADAGLNHRDATFFRTQDGTLTNYARGVLIANAAWTAWRILVLFFSWVGLWVVSGHGCAGFCGPRYRWEEEEAEKTRSVYSDDASELDAVLWNWRECTRARIQVVYDFCLTIRPSRHWSQGGKKSPPDVRELLGSGPISSDAPFDGMEQVLAAVGFPTVPAPARRGLLSDQLFESPKEETPPVVPEFSSIIPKVVKRSSKEKQPTGPEAPLMTLPYPFTAPGAKMSSNDRVPFPPSTAPSDEHLPASGSGSSEETTSSEDVEEEGDEDEIDESEEPSSGRASGSMSSLGHPVASRYPFQFRRPVRGTSVASSSPTHMTPYSHTQSIQSRFSGRTESTGNQESSDSHSPRSHTTSGSEMASPLSQSSYGIPMPPRHPQQAQGRGRARAGTVPAVFPVSPTPVMFPRGGRPRARTRTESGATSSAGAFDPYGSDLDLSSSGGHASDQPEADESHEAERDDVVGLLQPPSAAPSPKTSFSAIRNRASTVSQHRLTHGSRSDSSSRNNSHSGSSTRSRTNSISTSVRSRAQSLIQSVGAASHSSLELVQTAIRSRAHSSMARLEEDTPYYSDNYTHSRSGSSSNNENYTFGHPLRTHLHIQDEPAVEEENTEDLQRWAGSGEPVHRDSESNLSVSAPSQRPSERTVSQALPQQRPETGSAPVEIPSPRSHPEPTASVASSHPDMISTAAQSFVTAPATIEGTTDSSGGTSWGTTSHMVDRSDGTWRPA
ncbi:hypothetical protein BD779DRAFT_1628013 [Infundibulicybe gibba]|nr:hypothetical protein BD779DRAFT_1628013 [Infundibulicybe gibba]